MSVMRGVFPGALDGADELMGKLREDLRGLGFEAAEVFWEEV